MCLSCSHGICQAWPLRPFQDGSTSSYKRRREKKHPHQPDFKSAFSPTFKSAFSPTRSTWRTTLHLLCLLRAFSLLQNHSSGSLFQRQRSEHLYSRKQPLNRSLFPMWSLMMLGMCLSLPASAVDTPPGYLTTTSRFTLWEGRGVTSSILGSEPGTRMQSTLTLTICGFLCHEITRCTSMYQEDSELVLEFTFLSSDTQTGDSNWKWFTLNWTIIH